MKHGIAREENGNAVSERISDVVSSKLDNEKTCFSPRRVIILPLMMSLTRKTNKSVCYQIRAMAKKSWDANGIAREEHNNSVSESVCDVGSSKFDEKICFSPTIVNDLALKKYWS